MTNTQSKLMYTMTDDEHSECESEFHTIDLNDEQEKPLYTKWCTQTICFCDKLSLLFCSSPTVLQPCLSIPTSV